MTLEVKQHFDPVDFFLKSVKPTENQSQTLEMEFRTHPQWLLFTTGRLTPPTYPPQKEVLNKALLNYQPLVSLNKALLNTCFWGG